MSPILLQTIYYAVVMMMSLVFVDLLTQGFFHKYVKVFGSLGRQCFIKVRQTTYDGITIGKEDEGFLIFKYHGKGYRMPIPNDKKVFYRFLFVSWIDVDGEKWAITQADYSAVSSSDPSKVENLMNRILTLPEDDDINQTKTLIIVAVILGILIITALIFEFILMQKIDGLSRTVLTIVQQTTPTVQSASI